MSKPLFQSAIRVGAVAMSTLVAGIYIYDRSGGDLFGLRAAESSPPSLSPTQGDAPGEPSRDLLDHAATPTGNGGGELGPMPAWYTGSTIVPDPLGDVQQTTSSPSPHAPNATPLEPPVSQGVRHPVVLPGSKSAGAPLPWIGNQQ